MCHEIRSPMNGIYGSLQLLQKSEQNVEEHDIISKALMSCQSILTIINDILDFSKIESGQLELNVASFDMCE